jgi:threonine dehydrogenase-like Zn-dependent dehydrogenase
MKAARFHKTGGPEVLIYEDVPDPVPGPGQILLKVEAAGVNYVGIMRRRGDQLHEPTPLPFIVGYEMAGTVAGLGAGVTLPITSCRLARPPPLIGSSRSASRPAKSCCCPGDRPVSSAVLGRGNWRWFGRGPG